MDFCFLINHSFIQQLWIITAAMSDTCSYFIRQTNMGKNKSWNARLNHFGIFFNPSWIPEENNFILLNRMSINLYEKKLFPRENRLQFIKKLTKLWLSRSSSNLLNKKTTFTHYLTKNALINKFFFYLIYFDSNVCIINCFLFHIYIWFLFCYYYFVID